MKKIIFLLTSSILIFSAFSTHAADQKIKAPDFTLKSSLGENLKLSEQRGNVIMLNFWASWCGSCRQEMPYIEALYAKYKNLGFSVWGINVDEQSEDAKKLLHDIKVSFPILYDPKNNTPKLYELEAMPSTFMIDRDGYVRFAHRGYLPGYEDSYEKQIKQLVME